MDLGLKDILAIWGAILSTVLAVDKLKQSLKRLHLRAFWDPHTDTLSCEITNVSGRPITLTQVDIAYGIAPRQATPLATLSGHDIHLLDGQLTRVQVARKILIATREQKGLLMRPRGLVWLRASLAGHGSAHTAVAIDPQAIGAEPEWFSLSPYVAAGLLLGYSQTQVAEVIRRSHGEVYK